MASVNLDCVFADYHHLWLMKQSDIFRENAENCRELADDASSLPAVRRYCRMAEAWIALADEQDWLDGEVPPLSPADRPSWGAAS